MNKLDKENYYENPLDDPIHYNLLRLYISKGWPQEQAEFRVLWKLGKLIEAQKESHREFCKTFQEKPDIFSNDYVKNLRNIVNDSELKNKILH